MQLRDLLAVVETEPALAGVAVLGATTDRLAVVEVERAVHDSRTVRPGDLFCCVTGQTTDGHAHAPAAVRAGAAALVAERSLDLGVPELVVADVRAAMGPLAAALAGHPSHALDVIGVTGTNGKTTTTHLLAAVLEAAGRRCGLIGTLSGARTTPEAPELQALLADLVREGYDSVAMEVSSHALDQHRVDGTRVRVAVFTNLSRDHLDHHGDMASYFQAKARLFEAGRCELAVVNLDDPHGRLLRDAAQVPSVGYSLDDAADLEVGATGSRFTWDGVPMAIALPGRFNVSNALAAATVARELGVATDDIAAGLASVRSVPGRFEQVDVGQPWFAAVDFAHTPDGLEHLLDAAREIAGGGRVVVVFGAGGDRDRTKRPEMGSVATRLADVVVLTTDNPRHEDPAAIMADVQRGIDHPGNLITEPDRRRAIARGVALVGPGDVLVVAGKGHEQHQIVGDEIIPFDDREVLREALAQRMQATSR